MNETAGQRVPEGEPVKPIRPEKIDDLEGAELVSFIRAAQKGAYAIGGEAADKLGVGKPASRRQELTNEERDQLYITQETHRAWDAVLDRIVLLSATLPLKEIEAKMGMQFDRNKLAELALKSLEK